MGWFSFRRKKSKKSLEVNSPQRRPGGLVRPRFVRGGGGDDGDVGVDGGDFVDLGLEVADELALLSTQAAYQAAYTPQEMAPPEPVVRPTDSFYDSLPVTHSSAERCVDTDRGTVCEPVTTTHHETPVHTSYEPAPSYDPPSHSSYDHGSSSSSSDYGSSSSSYDSGSSGGGFDSGGGSCGGD